MIESTLRVPRMPRGTPLGRGTGLVGAGLLLAGLNTGNNLFYLLFTILASLELLGFWIAGRVLRGITVEVGLPRRGRVACPCRFTVSVRNGSRRLPAPALAWRIEASDGATAEVRTPALAPGASATATGRLDPARRGRLRLARAEAATDFPFGLVRRRVHLEPGPHEILVAPLPLPGHPRSESRSGEPRSTRPRGRGEEPVEAREHRVGDDARGIDWKASARLDRLMWRERRGGPPRARVVHLDRDTVAGPGFEARVSKAAGAVLASLARGCAVGFRTDEWSVPPRWTPGQRGRILDYLAVVRPRHGAPEP